MMNLITTKWYGGGGGSPWDDGIFTTVRQFIIVSTPSWFNAIQIEYDDNGCPVWSDEHGNFEREGSNVDMVNLDYPDEYLTSISGHYSSGDFVIIESLTIESNRKTYGPYGKEIGTFFSTKSTPGKIIGFFGKSGYCLDSIGVYLEPLSNIHSLIPSVDAIGGRGGHYWNDKSHTTVRKIIVDAGPTLIHSIQVEYDNNGQSMLLPRHGAEPDKGNEYQISLDYPDEYLTSISGHIREQPPVVLQSLTFQSNRRTFGPYGKKDGRGFSLPIPSTGGKITGFFGWSDAYLNAIGVHFESLGTFGVQDRGLWDDRRHITLKQVKAVPLEDATGGKGSHYSDYKSLRTTKRFGGAGGSEWDDGIFTTVRQFIIVSTPSWFNAIQIVYDDNGCTVWSDEHGNFKREGSNVDMVKLDYPDEYLTSISGHYSSGDFVIIESLTIESNRKTYGPYGKEIGTFFSTKSTPGKIIGFFGKSGYCLDSIGVYLEPISNKLSLIPSVDAIGGRGGHYWNDKSHTTVRKIIVDAGSTLIHSIQVEYDNNGQSMLLPRHGAEPGKGAEYQISLDYPDEYLTSISGHIRANPPVVVQSLAFQSNRRTFGPYGKKEGRGFSLPIPSTGRKITGFFGWSDAYLNAIGVLFESLGTFGGPDTFETGNDDEELAATVQRNSVKDEEFDNKLHPKSDDMTLVAIPRLPVTEDYIADSSMQDISTSEILKVPESSQLMKLPAHMHSLKIEGCDVLQSLHEGLTVSNTYVEDLTIVNCFGLESFPEGYSFTALKSLNVRDCRKFVFIQPLQKMHQYSLLEYLCIRGSCDSLQSFPLAFFPKLKSLSICDCENFSSISVPEGFEEDLISLEALEIRDCPNLASLPEGGLPKLTSILLSNCKNFNALPEQFHMLSSLHSLVINECPELVAIPRGGFPSNLVTLCVTCCHKLTPCVEWRLHELKNLCSFEIEGECREVESFPDEKLLPQNLYSLCISEFLNLKSLDSKGLQDLTSLAKLEINGCNNLLSLPDEGLPSSLSFLCINDCSLLKAKLQNKGSDWFKVAHIPSIEIDEEMISRV